MSISAAPALQRRWPQHEAYKPVAGRIAQVPSHWTVKRLRYLAQVNPPLTLEISEDAEVSFLPMERVGNQGQLDLSTAISLAAVKTGYTCFRDGDVVVAKITPCFENGKGALCQGLTNGVGFGTTELHVLRPGPEIGGRFLYYVTMSSIFRRSGIGEMSGVAGQQRVPDEFLRNFLCPVPPMPEQRSIIDFINRETARIDALLVSKERLVALLDEKRRTIAIHAIVRGLNPDVQMQDSCIPGIREVPAHWNVRRNKVIFVEVNDRSATGTEELLSVSHITGVTPRTEKDVSMFLAETNEGYKVCRPGDLVVNTMWAYMGALGIARCDGIVSPSYNVYRLRQPEEYVPEYLDYLYRLPGYVCEITRNSKGIWFSRLRLYPDAFLNMYTITPPVKEQQAILAFIGRAQAPIDRLIAKLRASIEVLTEYRGALISAAVTGSINVCAEAC